MEEGEQRSEIIIYEPSSPGNMQGLSDSQAIKAMWMGCGRAER